jgi:O-antigen/teichoic acid export membrane protein
MKKLLETTVSISTTEIVLIIVALIKNKYLAISIGPEGFGIYGLLLSFFNLAAVFSGTWLSTGATKYISEYSEQKDNNSVDRVYSFTVGLASVISVSMAIIMMVASENIRQLFLTEDVLPIYFLLFSVAFIGNSLRPVFLAMLQGLKKIRIVIHSRIMISIFEILAIVSLVYFFEMLGFMISICISSIFTLIVFVYYFRKMNFRIAIKYVMFDEVSIKLMKYGGINIFLAFGNLGAQFLQRKIILANMDLMSVGILHAAISIRNYSDIVGRGSGFYFLPRMSERLNKITRIQEINDYIYFSTVSYFVIGMSILLFRNEIITLLLSPEFIAVGSVLAWFIVAEFLHNIERPLGQTIIGTAALRTHSINTAGIFLSWIVFPIIYAPSIGVKSIALGSIIGSLISMFNSSLYLRKSIKYTPNYRNILLACFVLMCFFSATLIANSVAYKIMVLFGVILICILSLSKTERIRLSSLLKSSLSKIMEKRT